MIDWKNILELFGLYYARDLNFNIKDFIEFLNSKKEEIKAKNVYMELIVMLYNSLSSNDNVIKKQLFDLLDNDYKKIVLTGMKLNVEIYKVHDDDIKKILEEDKVEENIDKVICFLCEER